MREEFEGQCKERELSERARFLRLGLRVATF